MTKHESGIQDPQRDLYAEIARGRLGTSVVTNVKFGRNESVGTSDENINDIGGTYTYSTAAVTLYFSSSSASDTDQTVTVVGLDGNNNEVTITGSLNGQTKTALSTDLFRVYRAFISAGSALVGTLYIYEDDTVTNGVPQTSSKERARILVGNNQTQMAQITVPSGYEMVVTDFLMTSGKDNNMQFKARIRPSDGSAPWRVIFNHDVYRETLTMTPAIPWVIPANYDVEVLAAGGSGTSEVATSWSYVCYPVDD